MLSYNRVCDYENKLCKMNESLESRRLIGKAKWILINKHNLSEKEAYEVIRKKSRDKRIPMKSVADAIILSSFV